MSASFSKNWSASFSNFIHKFHIEVNSQFHIVCFFSSQFACHLQHFIMVPVCKRLKITWYTFSAYLKSTYNMKLLSTKLSYHRKAFSILLNYWKIWNNSNNLQIVQESMPQSVLQLLIMCFLSHFNFFLSSFFSFLLHLIGLALNYQSLSG